MGLSWLVGIYYFSKLFKLFCFSFRLPFLEGYMKILQGDINCPRVKLPENNLSVEEQVACLLELAQDRAILGMSYLGLQPWI